MNRYNAPPVSASETSFSLRASRELQRAFAPITTGPLATYLFSASPRIPSESFLSSQVLRITQTLTHSGLSDPRRGFRTPLMKYSPTTESGTVSLVLTPIKREANALLGVVSVAGAVMSNSLMPFSEALNHGILRGRFVYDCEKRQMVCLMDGISMDVLGVVSAKWAGENVRERFFFTIPKRQYSIDDMPKSAVVVLTNLEYRILKVRGSKTDNGLETGDDSIFENFTERQAQSAVVPLEESHAFDMSAMTTAVENLAKTMSGLYYGPNLKRDVINISTGELSSRASAKMVAKLSIPDQVDQCRVRRMVAQDYFLKLLPLGSECWFSQTGKQCSNIATDADKEVDNFVVQGTLVGVGDPLPDVYQLDSVVGNSSLSGKLRQTSTTPLGSSMLMGKMITPFAVQQPLDMHTCQAGMPGRVLTDEELKQEKDEERRMRNRLSAARSNERRKERERAQMKELEMLKERKTHLEKVHQRLVDENDTLRKNGSQSFMEFEWGGYRE